MCVVFLVGLVFFFGGGGVCFGGGLVVGFGWWGGLGEGFLYPGFWFGGQGGGMKLRSARSKVSLSLGWEGRDGTNTGPWGHNGSGNGQSYRRRNLQGLAATRGPLEQTKWKLNATREIKDSLKTCPSQPH